jgi:DNA primase
MGMLDFKEIKTIRITDVVGRYGIALKFKGEWACGVCPLPTHKPGDKGRNFTVNVSQNYWRCFSETCNANNGGKRGGDVINFVALMEKCREREAAQKLADWYLAGQTKTAPRMEKRSDSPQREHPKDYQNDNPRSDSVKYMQEIDLWFDLLMRRAEKEDDAAYLKRVRNGVKAQLIRSYKSGQRVAAGLPAEP